MKAANAGQARPVREAVRVTAADVKSMLDACRNHRVQFMDGVMFMHGHRLAMMRQTLDDGKSVGTIHRIVSQFSFKGSAEFLAGNIRVSSAPGTARRSRRSRLV